MSVNPLHDVINSIRTQLDTLEDLADQAMLGTLTIGEPPPEEDKPSKTSDKDSKK